MRYDPSGWHGRADYGGNLSEEGDSCSGFRRQKSSNGEEKTQSPTCPALTVGIQIATEDLIPAQRQACSHKQGGLKGVPVKPFCGSDFFALILQRDILDK